MNSKLLERAEKAKAAHAAAARTLATYRSSFELAKLTLSPSDFAAASARLEQQAMVVAVATEERDCAVAELNAQQTRECERQQREGDERELKTLEFEARSLSGQIDVLNVELRALPAKLQQFHGKHSAILKRIGELRQKLNPAPEPQRATWYEEKGTLANRIAEAIA